MIEKFFDAIYNIELYEKGVVIMVKTPKIKRMAKMEPIDLTTLLEKYEGKWVALTKYSPNPEVICSGSAPKIVYDRAVKKGCDSPVIFKVSSKSAQAMIL